MSNMQKMKTLTLQDVMFEITDQKAREDISANAKDIATNFKNTEANSGRISALENDLVAIDDFIKTAALTDRAFTSTKSAPSNSAPYAEVKEIGGMTRKCTNLFDASKASKGKVLKVGMGGESDDTMYDTSDFISVTPNSTITGNYIQHCAYYDNSKKYISDIGSKSFTVQRTLTVPSGAHYVRFSYKLSETDITKIQLNESDTLLPYEPYFEGLRSAKVTEVESVGANLFDVTKATIYSRINTNNGTVEMLSSSTDQASSDFIFVSPNTKYVLNFSYYSTGDYGMAFYDSNKGYISGTKQSSVEKSDTNTPFVFTTPNNCYYIRFSVGGGKSYNDVSLNKGDTVLPDAHWGVLFTLPIPEAIRNLDGYGWGINESVYNYVDFEKKKFVKRVGCVDMGTFTWGLKDGATSVFYAWDLRNIVKEYGALLCAKYDVGTLTEVYEKMIMDKAVCVGSPSYIGAADSAYTDAAIFKAAMSGVMLYYELAEPVITDISDLLPNGAISVEGGGTVRMVNEFGYDVPNEITFYTGNQEVGVAQVFVGDLIGKATHATHDSEGNEIANTYAAVIKDVVSNGGSAKVKEIPSNSAPYAEVKEIGGRTRKCTNSAKPFAMSVNGYTTTVASDGSIILSGAANAAVDTVITWVNPNPPIYINANEKCTIGITKDGAIFDKLGTRFVYTDDVGGTVYGEDNQDVTRPRKLDKVYLQFTPEVGDTTYCGTYRVMVNKGDTLLPYDPYFEGLRSANVAEVESVGINLFDLDDFANKNGFVAQSDGSYKGSDLFKDMWVNTNKKAGQIFLSYEGKTENSWALVFRFYYTDGTSSNEAILPTTSEFKTIVFSSNSNKTVEKIAWAYGQAGDYYVKNMMLSLVDTEYTPYVRNTLPIPEAIRNLDGYGWGINESVYNYVDFEKKQFVKRVGCVDLGTFDWTLETNSSGVTFFQTVASVYVADSANGVNTLCAPYTSVANREQLTDKTISPRNTAAINRMCVCDSTYTDVAPFKAAMSGVMLYYELAEPVITDISDLLPDGAIAVEEGGTITMVNEFGYDVPNTINFYLGKNEVIAADTFAGDLVGTASRAVCDKDGNPISGSYAKYADANGSLKASVSGQSPSVSLLRNSRFTFDENDVPTVEGETVWVLK